VPASIGANIAVLVARQPQNIIPLAPELKNTSTASMLFVFSR